MKAYHILRIQVSRLLQKLRSMAEKSELLRPYISSTCSSRVGYAPKYDHHLPPSPSLSPFPTSPYHRFAVAVGTAYTLPQLALYTELPTTVWLLTSLYVTLVTTLSVPIHVDHGVAVVAPVTGPTETRVVSAQAPDQTVGPGMM
jgi:hypothetical protein